MNRNNETQRVFHFYGEGQSEANAAGDGVESANCNKCGKCCVANGLIPPLIPDEEAPEWLWTLVKRLRAEFGDVAEDYRCVFLTDDMRCAIHEMERPECCRDFLCDQAECSTPSPAERLADPQSVNLSLVVTTAKKNTNGF